MARKLTQAQIDAAESKMLRGIALARAREIREVKAAGRRFLRACDDAMRPFEAISSLARMLEREARK